MADYSIAAVTRRAVYTGSAGTGPYAFSFACLATSDLAVYKNTSKLTETSDYTVTLSSTDGTGSVTLGSAADSDDTITLVGARALARTSDFVTAGSLTASALNTDFDSLVIFAQQLSEENTRALMIPVTEGISGSTSMALPAVGDRKGKLLQFNSSTGNPEVTTYSLSGVTASSAELNILDGCTLTTTELNYYDGFTIADEDNMSSNSATKLCTQQSIKAYVDTQIATEDTIAELNDTTISSAASGNVLIYDGSDSWDNKALSGDVTLASTGAVTIANNAVETAMINADAVTNAKIADDAIDSEHYVDGSIDTAHLSADCITGAKIADDAIDSEHYTDGSIDTAHLAADAVTGAKIADDAIDSEHYTDGSIDTAHIANSQVTADKLASDAVTTAKITDLNVTTAKIAADAVTAAKIADDAISEEHLDPTVISSLADTTIASADYLMFWDADDSALKKVDAAELGVGSALTDIVGDTTPQLGGNLDTNSHNIAFDDAHGINDENGNEQIVFQTTASAVNYLELTNAATGNLIGVISTGSDTNVGMEISTKGSGKVTIDATTDVNGNELILDADADTSITADTDDQIDIKIAGADDFKFIANQFQTLSGSTQLHHCRPYFSAYLAAHQTVSTATATKVTLDTESLPGFDSDATFDSSTNYRFTPGVAGYYLICASVVANATDCTFLINRIMKNGSDNYDTTFDLRDGGSAGDSPGATQTRVIYLDDDDYIELFAQVTSGSTCQVAGHDNYSGYNTHMAGFKIG